MSDNRFDAIVVGAGPAGEECAGRIAEGGLTVALVEGDKLGGECSFYACMPSKGLLRPGEAIAEARRIPGAREAASGQIDVGSALARRDEIVHHGDDSSQLEWLDERGVEVIRGSARLDGTRAVMVDGRRLDAHKAVVVAVGSDPAIPSIPGLDEVDPWTNREATTAGEAPASMLVLGGGVVGVEMAQAWSSLGVAVALIEPGERVLSHEEPFAGDLVDESLRRSGVDLRLETKALEARRTGNLIELELSDGSSATAERLLVATGRRPRTGDLGLESVGLEPGEAIAVDDQLRATGSDWLYAIGDVNERALLTHAGKYQARVAADVILGKQAAARWDIDPGPPRVTFTDPQVAAVGLTAAAAADRGLSVRCVDHDASQVAGGSFYGRGADSPCRLVVDERRQVIVGATFTGPDIGDLLHSATIAIVGEVPLERLWHAIPSFPTRSEVWLRLLQAYGL